MIQIYKLLPDTDIGTNAFAVYIDQLSEIDQEWIAATTRGALPGNNPMPHADGEDVPGAG